MTAPPVIAKKSFRASSVTLHITLSSRGYYPGNTVRMAGSTDLTTDQARELAETLLALAKAADARAAAKVEAELRRQQWRDREVTAGRRQVIALR